ncbi:hypothetical protein RhiirA1_500642, partial [Rhizophagus irregularis]
FSQLDIYLATYPDRMHHLDLGLYKYQVIYTQEMLKNICGQAAVDKLDERLATIPRFPGLKIFKHGLKNIKLFTANKYRSMMKVFLFVIEGLIIKYSTEQNSKKQDDTLVDVYYRWNKIYSRSGLKLPKLHNWVYHIINSIEEFGAINGFTTETYEFLHKDYVKIPYRSSNKREAIGQIINTVSIFLKSFFNNIHLYFKNHLFYRFKSNQL